MTYEMATKKKHLKYQAKKSPSVSREAGIVAVNESTIKKVKQIKAKNSKISPLLKKEPLVVTELTTAESKVVRRELIHLLVSASVIMVLYVGLWFILERAGLEARLTDIIKL